MRKSTKLKYAGLLLGVFLLPVAGWADRWDVRKEAREGAREIQRERREAAREILEADTPWERRHEIREAERQIGRERREARREVRREVRQSTWDW